MTSPASAVGPDGFVAKILPSSRDDVTWHGDWVTVTIFTKGTTGWAKGEPGTLHVFMPQQSSDVTYSVDPATGVQVHAAASVTTWVEVATAAVAGDGTRTFVSVPSLLSDPRAPYTPTLFSVTLGDGRESWRSVAANQLTNGGNQDLADAIDGFGSTDIMFRN